jgi:hypothetical protein
MARAPAFAMAFSSAVSPAALTVGYVDKHSRGAPGSHRSVCVSRLNTDIIERHML